MSIPVDVVREPVSHSAPASLSATLRSSLSGVPSLMTPTFSSLQWGIGREAQELKANGEFSTVVVR